MPYGSSDEEVWEEEEVSGDDDIDGGPGFLDPTRRHSHWDVNCPFPFTSDQGGHDKTNCRPVILSTQGSVSQKTALTFG